MFKLPDLLHSMQMNNNREAHSLNGKDTQSYLSMKNEGQKKNYVPFKKHNKSGMQMKSAAPYGLDKDITGEE